MVMDSNIMCLAIGSYLASQYRSSVKALYFAVFPMNVTSLEFNFVDFELLNCYNALPKLI